ncbi:MAG: S-layer homology domain-containing protein [Candidatus Peregrinibacteria bacterium]
MRHRSSYHWFVSVLFAIIVAPLFFSRADVYASSQVDFRDVPRTSPYFLPVRYLSGLEVFQGYEDGTFRPGSPINRAEVLKVIIKGANAELPRNVDEIPFSDVQKDYWFAGYVMAGFAMGIVAGDGVDGSFAAGRQVNKAEFLKMLLIANQVNVDAFKDQESAFADVPKDAWFAPYINYAVTLGVVDAGDSKFVYPAKPLTRGEVAEMIYLLTLVKKGMDTQFLLDRTEDQLTQIEVYVAANHVDLAKKSSQLAVDLSQQALKNMSNNNIVLGAAKLSRAYDYLVDSYVLGVSRKNQEAALMANQAISKATEAWEANNATQPIARHIKDRAREILAQVGGEEWLEEGDLQSR